MFVCVCVEFVCVYEDDELDEFFHFCQSLYVRYPIFRQQGYVEVGQGGFLSRCTMSDSVKGGSEVGVGEITILMCLERD